MTNACTGTAKNADSRRSVFFLPVMRSDSDQIWDSIASDQKALPLTDEQKAELNRRLDAYETDGKRGRLAAESISEIRRKL